MQRCNNAGTSRADRGSLLSMFMSRNTAHILSHATGCSHSDTVVNASDFSFERYSQEVLQLKFPTSLCLGKKCSYAIQHLKLSR